MRVYGNKWSILTTFDVIFYRPKMRTRPGFQVRGIRSQNWRPLNDFSESTSVLAQ